MKFSAIFLLGFFISATVQASEDALKEELTESISRFLPDVKVDSIQPTPIKGLYQVVVDSEILYMSSDGAYVIQGEIYDINERRNLTEDVRASSRVKLISDIKKDEYIEFTGKNPHDAIYVFTDVHCGYCRKLHQDVPELNARGISVRYLAYPRAGIDSETGRLMSSVWCSDNRQEALTAAKNDQPIETKSCDNPVAEEYELGRKMGVRGTPSIFLQNGRNLPGYLPPDEIEKQLSLK